ncbi:MAG: type I restriction endonuclease subunit R [Candidatus Helarchaeota archaeon]
MFTEKSTVEDYIIENLIEKGWQFIPAEDLERENYQEPLLLKNFFRMVKSINNFALTESDLNRIYVELNSRSSGIEGIKTILRFLKQGIAIKLEKTKELKFVKIFDYENIDKNEFIVTKQIKIESSTDKRIPDILLFINGIPVVIIECKNTVDPSVSWVDAYKQIKSYERAIPELFKYVQFGIAAEVEARYFPIVPWQEDIHIYTWKHDVFDILDATLEMLIKDNLLNLIKNYIFIRAERGKTTKVITRYMQFRASNKIYDRVIYNLLGKEEKDTGLIWHWQGSGKTLTMIFACHKLYREELLENPTIFFIVDRIELEEQLYQEITALDLGFKPELISSIKDLKEILRHDGGRGKRGIFITLIHKFRKDELDDLERELKENKDEEVIIRRKNIVGFIDEGHRTQYGTLAAQMRRILKNGFFFAFTGTPIAKKGRDTYLVFSYPPEEKYLDKYFFLDSIKDGFTVPLRFQPRLEKDVHLDKENLEAFLAQELEEIPEEFREEVEQKIRKRLSSIKVFMKNPERIEMIANDIAQHFQENIENKFKAMIVAIDREACVMYKNALDNLIPPEYSEIVMTFVRNEKSRRIVNFLEELQKRIHGKNIEDFRKETIEKFKNEDLPQILIVTNMLLTGFDAPILQTMYLDKPLKEHRLLQGVARVNRPFKDLKEAGLIIDYVGVLGEFEKALAIYSRNDVKGIITDLDEERKEFIDLINETLNIFEGIDRTKNDRSTLMKAIKKILEENEITKKFETNYKILRRKFELLGPDPIKIEYLNDFKWIIQIYYAYLRHTKRIDPDEVDRYIKKYYRRTLKYIHDTVEIENLRNNFPILNINEKYLEKLDKIYSDINDKISDVAFALKKFILVERTRNPIYETILEKVERILQERKEKTKSNEQILTLLKEVVNQVNEIKKRKIALEMKDMEYNILLLLEDNLGKNDSLIDDVRKLFEKIAPLIFKGWSLKKRVTKDIGIIIRRQIRKYNLSHKQLDELYEKIIETLKKFD